MRSVRTGEPVKQGLIGHSKDLSLYLRWAAETILGRSEDLIYIKRKTSLADVLKIHYTVGK